MMLVADVIVLVAVYVRDAKTGARLSTLASQWHRGAGLALVVAHGGPEETVYNVAGGSTPSSLAKLRGALTNPSYPTDRIKTLVASFDDRLGTGDLQRLRRWTALASVAFCGCGGVTDAGVTSLLDGLPCLTTLRINDCSQVHGSCLNVLSSAEALRSLELLQMSADFNDGAAAALRHAPQLTTLKLNGCGQLTDDVLRHVAAITNLEEIGLPICPFVGAGFAHLVALPRLHTVQLAGSAVLTDDALAHMGGIATLTDIDLCQCTAITSVGIERLSRLPKLASISVSFCEQLPAETMVYLQAHRASLRQLQAAGCPLLNRASMAALACATALQRLELTACPGLTAGSLEPLQSLVQLKALVMAFGSGFLRGEGLPVLAKLVALEELDASSTAAVDTTFLTDVARVPTLKKLFISECPGVNDAALASLSNLKALELLNVAQNRRVTDAALRSFADMKSLRFFQAWRSCVTAAGIAELQRALPLVEAEC